MELRQLEYFIAIAEEGGFTRAADRIHISQSGVSAQLRRLERELGAQLIDRSSRIASLTPAGEAALPHAHAALSSAAALRQAVDEVSGLLRGRLRIGMVVGCTITPLFAALSDFHRAHPGVEIRLTEDPSDRMVEAVRAGRLDLALIGTDDAELPGLESFTIVREPIIALAPPDHEFAVGGTIALDELAAQPIVCMPEGTGIRTVLDTALSARGLSATIVVEASAASSVADLAARGLGIAVLSASMADDFAGALVPIPIVDADLPARLAFTWADRPNPALHELVRRCEQAFATAGE